MFYRTMKLTLFLLLMPTFTSALAQEDAPKINVEFNRLTDTANGCRFTFVVSNQLKQSVSKAVFELAFFNTEGLVERLTALNFGSLAAGRASVKQFELSGPQCSNYSRLLINAVKACDGLADGVKACDAVLVLSNKTEIKFGV